MGMMDIRRRIMLSSPHLETASGTVVSFSTGLTLPLKEVTVGIEPVQSGTGDPSPNNIRPITGWTGAKISRTGKNLIPDGTDTNNGYVYHRFIKQDGTEGTYSTTPDWYISEYFKVMPSTVYTLSVNSSTIQNPAVCFYDANKAYITGTKINKQRTQQITTPANAVYARCSQREVQDASDCIRFEIGSTETDAEFYTGQTYPITFMGSNLHNSNTDIPGYYISATGVTTLSSYYSYSALIPVDVGKTYIFSGVNARNSSDSKRLHGYNANGEWVKQIDYVSASANSPYSVIATIDDGIAYVRISFRTADTDIKVSQVYIVYDGTLTLDKDGNGTLVVDRGIYIVNGTETFIDVTSSNAFYLTTPDLSVFDVSNDNDYCSMFKPTYATASSGMENGEIARFNKNNNRLYIKSSLFAGYTAEQLSEYFSNNNFQYCGKLITPRTYTITASKIRTLFGQNNIWSDTGDTSLKYWKQ